MYRNEVEIIMNKRQAKKQRRKTLYETMPFMPLREENIVFDPENGYKVTGTFARGKSILNALREGRNEA